jgi:hypothetical protein
MFTLQGMVVRRFSTASSSETIALLKDLNEIFGQHYVRVEKMYNTGFNLVTGAVALNQLFTGFQNSWLAARIKMSTDERFDERFDTLNKKMDEMAMRLPPAKQ